MSFRCWTWNSLLFARTGYDKYLAEYTNILFMFRYFLSLIWLPDHSLYINMSYQSAVFWAISVLARSYRITFVASHLISFDNNKLKISSHHSIYLCVLVTKAGLTVIWLYAFFKVYKTINALASKQTYKKGGVKWVYIIKI
jgi:hypothetical protein